MYREPDPWVGPAFEAAGCAAMTPNGDTATIQPRGWKWGDVGGRPGNVARVRNPASVHVIGRPGTSVYVLRHQPPKLGVARSNRARVAIAFGNLRSVF